MDPQKKRTWSGCRRRTVVRLRDREAQDARWGETQGAGGQRVVRRENDEERERRRKLGEKPRREQGTVARGRFDRVGECTRPRTCACVTPTGHGSKHVACSLRRYSYSYYSQVLLASTARPNTHSHRPQLPSTWSSRRILPLDSKYLCRGHAQVIDCQGQAGVGPATTQKG